MPLLTLDIATVMGFALGTPPDIRRSGSVRLKKPKDDVFVAYENVGLFLRDMWVLESERPDLIVCEAPLPVSASRGGNAAALAWGCLAVVHFMAKAYGIPIRLANADKVRGHYTGKARWGDRDEGKRQVVARARLLGHIPKDCNDNDRADACAIFDWASHTIFRVRAPAALVMFGEKVPA